MPKEYVLDFDKIAESLEQMVDKFENMSKEEREMFLKSTFVEKKKDKHAVNYGK